MSQPQNYSHAYTKYVTHILNNSPSKAAYTFPKAERFSSPKKDEFQISVPYFQQKNQRNKYQKETKLFNRTFNNNKQDRYKVYVSPQKSPLKNNNQLSPYCKKLSPKNKNIVNSNKAHQRNRSKQFNQSNNRLLYTQQRNQSRKRSPRTNLNQIYHKKDIGISPASKQKNINSKSKEKNFNRSKSKSQRFLHAVYLSRQQINRLYRQKDSILKNGLLQKQESPIRKFKQTSRSRSNSSSPSRQKVIRTYTDYLEQIDHPSKHITPHGYYPNGTEINENGKYVVSSYKNIQSHSFGSRPQTTKSPQRKLTKNLFSKSPLRQPQRIQLGEQKISHLNSSLQRLKQNTLSWKPISQIYIPFSQFGDINQNQLEKRRKNSKSKDKSKTKKHVSPLTKVQRYRYQF